MSHIASDSAFRGVIHRICERIGSPRASELCHCIDANQPVPKWFPELGTGNALDFANDYFLSKLLSKWKGWQVKGVNQRANALIGWEADEVENSKTNKRIQGLIGGTGFPGSYLSTIISMAQSNIQQVIGTFRLSKVLSACRWGPGATWDLPRGTYKGSKLTTRMSVTRESLPFMKLLIEGDPNWCEALTGFYPVGPFSLVKDFWVITECSRFATVPKEWDKDRCIDMQPTANGYLQQGVGRYFRSRLFKFGIDLDSQEYNQEGARLAFSTGLSTIDLQSASDSVTYQLVSLLFPWDWCQYMCALRTTYTQFGHKGPQRKIEKFSAMGNAFTFELETLIFWAISKAVSEVEGVKDFQVLVYGDDIIVGRNAFDGVVYVLNYLGFRVNESKSFRSGSFFESCGRHFLEGSDITPIYQKNVVNSPEECIRFHNRLVRWSVRIHGDPWYFDEALMVLQALYYDTSHNPFLLQRDLPRISLVTEGDDGFLSDESFFHRDPHGGYYTTVLRSQIGRVRNLNEAAYLQLKLNDPKVQNGSPRGHVEEPSDRGRYRLLKAYFYR